MYESESAGIIFFFFFSSSKRAISKNIARRGVYLTRDAKYAHALIEYRDIARVSLARANRVICIIELDIIKRERRFENCCKIIPSNRA